MKITIFRTPKPRRFVHKPIYWNPEEDERKERAERVRKEKGEALKEGEEFSTSIKRGTFRKGGIGEAPMRDDSYHKEKRRANVRLILIIVALLVLAVMMYVTSSDYLLL